MLRHPIALVLCVFATSSAGNCPVCLDGAVGNWNSSTITIPNSPTGNPPTTFSGLNVQGVTEHDDEREYLVSMGLISNRGAQSRPTPYHDKVTLYVGAEAWNGTGDVWAINPLVTQDAGSGDYNAQGIELDFNNNNAHRGDIDAGFGLAEPVSYGLAVTGAGAYRSTSAYLVSGPGPHRIWNRGFTLANDCVEGSSFQDLGSPDKSLDVRGNPNYAMYQESPSSVNYFAGPTAVGVSKDAAAALTAKARAKAKNARAAADATVEIDDPVPVLTIGTGTVHIDGRIRRRDLNVQLAHQESIHFNGRATVSEEQPTSVQLPKSALPEHLMVHRLVAKDAFISLTPIGAPMPGLYASELDLETGKFTVTGAGRPGVVHWHVVLSVSDYIVEIV